MPCALYTIGHSTHAADHLIGLLKRHGVDAVFDVRSSPYSRYNPQYNRERIADEIESSGIQYAFLGKELGARSDNPDHYAQGKVQFNQLASDPAFQSGLTRIRSSLKQHSIALMCAEKDPICCHRTILVARHLRREFPIQHILGDGSIEDNAATEMRLMTLLRIQPDLIRDECQCIEDVYNLQGRKIAYSKKDGAQQQSQASHS